MPISKSNICVSTVNSFLACDCKTEGTREGEKTTCTDKDGKCFCKDNVGGDKCDSCLPEYYDFPTCTRKHFQKEYIK